MDERKIAASQAGETTQTDKSYRSAIDLQRARQQLEVDPDLAELVVACDLLDKEGPLDKQEWGHAFELTSRAVDRNKSDLVYGLHCAIIERAVTEVNRLVAELNERLSQLPEAQVDRKGAFYANFGDDREKISRWMASVSSAEEATRLKPEDMLRISQIMVREIVIPYYRATGGARSRITPIKEIVQAAEDQIGEKWRSYFVNMGN